MNVCLENNDDSQLNTAILALDMKSAWVATGKLCSHAIQNLWSWCASVALLCNTAAVLSHSLTTIFGSSGRASSLMKYLCLCISLILSACGCARSLFCPISLRDCSRCTREKIPVAFDTDLGDNIHGSWLTRVCEIHHLSADLTKPSAKAKILVLEVGVAHMYVYIVPLLLCYIYYIATSIYIYIMYIHIYRYHIEI